MKTHLLASALLLAACAGPRAERDEPPRAERDDAPRDRDLPPDEPSDEGPAARTITCTRRDPCPLDVVDMARRRIDLEASMEEKIARASESPRSKEVADSWIQTLSRSIVEEKNRFSKWCELAQSWSTDRRKAGGAGLTQKDLVKWTGQPGHEVRPESRDTSIDSRAWTWEVSGPISQNVSFQILFVRPAGTDDPFIFGGCQWCASGGPATSRGCESLPAARP